VLLKFKPKSCGLQAGLYSTRTVAFPLNDYRDWSMAKEANPCELNTQRVRIVPCIRLEEYLQSMKKMDGFVCHCHL